MDSLNRSRIRLVEFLAQRTRSSPTMATIVTITFALLATQVVAQNAIDCGPSATNSFGYSKSVPCQNATCVDYSSAGLGTTPTCANPAGLTITKVSVSVTATKWSNCTTGQTTASCQELPTSCANYYMWADYACTVQCKTIDGDLPMYCKGP